MNEINEIVIKPLEIQDIAEILIIEQESFPSPWTKNMFEQELLLKHSHFFVLKLNGISVGYGGLWEMIDEAHILTLAVKNEYSRRGLGTKILSHLLDFAKSRSMKSSMLEVRIGNTPAIKLYEKFGFSPIGTRKNYYPDSKEDAVIMRKDFI